MLSLKKTLQLVFLIALIGVLFSGTLTYQELFSGSVASCPAVGAPGTILGYPACVYGFFMYLLLVIISGLGLWGARKR